MHKRALSKHTLNAYHVNIGLDYMSSIVSNFFSITSLQAIRDVYEQSDVATHVVGKLLRLVLYEVGKNIKFLNKK